MTQGRGLRERWWEAAWAATAFAPVWLAMQGSNPSSAAVAAVAGATGVGAYLCNRLTARHDQLDAARDALAATLENSHLAKTSAHAVELCVRDCAPADLALKAEYEDLAITAGTRWLELHQQCDPRLALYREDQLGVRLVEHFAQPDADPKLAPDFWSQFLRECAERGRDARHLLGYANWEELGASVSAVFDRQIYNAFNASDGAAYRGQVLRLLCGLATTMGKLVERQTSPAAAETVTAPLAALVARIGEEWEDLRGQLGGMEAELQEAVNRLTFLVAELRAMRTETRAMHTAVIQKLDGAAAGIERIEGALARAAALPVVPVQTTGWPAAAPFHNRRMPPTRAFEGRDELLEEVGRLLAAGRPVALTQPAVLHGTGGVGKTRAAVEFVRRHGADCTLCLFLDAETPDQLHAALSSAADMLGLGAGASLPADELVPRVLRLLRTVPRALVVLDNADTPAAAAAVRVLCRQPGDVRWLITSRRTDWEGTFECLPVERLAEPAAVRLLQAQGTARGHQPGRDGEAAVVVRELGGLPLALQQAASYVSHRRISWRAYAALLATRPAEALSRAAGELKEGFESVLTTYALSLQQVSPTAAELLHTAARLAAAPIPEAWFVHAGGAGAERDRAALAELADYSLVTWRDGVVELHRAVALASRVGEAEAGRGQNGLTAAIERLKNWLVPRWTLDEVEPPRVWPVWAAARPHLEAVLTAVEQGEVSFKPAGSVALGFPLYLRACGEYHQAERFGRLAVAGCTAAFGAEAEFTLDAHNNQGVALEALGNYADAETQYRFVLAVRERTLGPKHPETLTSRNNVAGVLRSQGKAAEAEAEHRAVHAAREEKLGPRYRDTLASRSNLALCLLDQGRVGEALAEHQAVLAVREQDFGVEDPETIWNYATVAWALMRAGRLAEAATHAERAVILGRRVLGPEHPWTKIFERNQARIAQAQAAAASGT